MIRDLLLRQWDPIGINEVPEAADEYDSYIGGVYDLLEQGASEADIANHLRAIEVDRMEMVDAGRNPFMPDAKRQAVACSLAALRRHFR